MSARVLFYRGLAHYYKGDLRHAESQFRRAYELESAHPHAQYAQAFLHALAGKNDEGIRLLRDFERGYQADGEMLYKVAQAYAMLGDKHSSLRLLRQSLEHNFYCYPYFTHDLLLESLRAEPEYSELMDRRAIESLEEALFPVVPKCSQVGDGGWGEPLSWHKLFGYSFRKPNRRTEWPRRNPGEILSVRGQDAADTLLLPHLPSPTKIKAAQK